MEKRIADYLKSRDSRLNPLIEKYPGVCLTPSRDYFSDLASAIVCQQLSDKAGAAIWRRFEALFVGKKVTPRYVSEKSIEELRTSGVSNSKAQYIKNVADAFLNQTVDPEKFREMTDEEIIKELVKIKGVGKWTAEMFCVFSLGREDIFSLGDLGLNNALMRLYKRKKPFSGKFAERITGKWSPYRSYASLLLWKSLEKS
jgi:DNA-3-methyladenine glycosylase II